MKRLFHERRDLRTSLELRGVLRAGQIYYSLKSLAALKILINVQARDAAMPRNKAASERRAQKTAQITL